MDPKYGTYTNMIMLTKSISNFVRAFLGVRSQTTNYAVYGDLGRFPLSVIAKERAIKYWLKVISYQNSSNISGSD